MMTIHTGYEASLTYDRQERVRVRVRIRVRIRVGVRARIRVMVKGCPTGRI
jgi:hypothetical protein